MPSNTTLPGVLNGNAFMINGKNILKDFNIINSQDIESTLCSVAGQC